MTLCDLTDRGPARRVRFLRAKGILAIHEKLYRVGKPNGIRSNNSHACDRSFATANARARRAIIAFTLIRTWRRVMAEADLGDISKAATRESDVDTLIRTLKKVVQKYGAFLTTRIFAFVLASYKRNRFEEMLSVKESRTAKYSGYPSALVGEDTSGERQPDMGLDH